MIFENTEVSVIKSNRKSISIQVKPNEVVVCAPARMKDKEIARFFETKIEWIERHLQIVNERQRLLNELEPYSEDEIKAFIQKAKEEIPKRVKIYADKIGVTCNRITISNKLKTFKEWSELFLASQKPVLSSSEYEMKKNRISYFYSFFGKSPTLTNEDKKMFTDYVDTYIKFLSICNADSFIAGFRLGARFTYDTFVETRKDN